MVTKYFALVFRGSIEMKSVKPRQTGDKYPAYKIYLLNEVQCLCHENKLRNLSHIYTHRHKHIYISKFNGNLDFLFTEHLLQTLK